MSHRLGDPIDPTHNGWLGIPDPADEVQSCAACGDDYQPGKACSCPPWAELWNPR